MICICFSVYGQTGINRLSFKAGFSNSTQQWGLSPFSHIRKFNRSIQSGFAGLSYTQPIKMKSQLILGVQYVEKGFRIEYSFEAPNQFYQDAGYQHLLQYLEVPLYYRFSVRNTFFSAGVIYSYLLNDVYSYRENIKSVNSNNGQATEYDIAYNVSYNKLYNRFETSDFGLGIGIGHRFNKHIELEMNLQKHFIQIDKWKQRDLVYNLTVLLGLKYSF
jgi:hypothetical protein